MNRLPIIPIITSHRKYINDADPDTIKILHSYTGANMKWMVLQDFLRKRSLHSYGRMILMYKNIEAVHNAITRLNTFILNAPTTSIPLKVYRGTGGVSIGEIGDTVVDWSFSGTSFSPSIAAGFTESPECCLYEFNLPANSPFLFIGFISQVSSEYEVLLPAGSEYKITGSRYEMINGTNHKIYECEFTKNIHLDPIFTSDPIESLVIDDYTLAVIVGGLRQVIATYNAIKKYGNESALSGSKKTLEQRLDVLKRQFANLLTNEEILHLFYNSDSSSEEKNIIQKIHSYNTSIGGGRKKKTRRNHLNKSRNSSHKRKKTSK
jgi:hypothetical protein